MRVKGSAHNKDYMIDMTAPTMEGLTSAELWTVVQEVYDYLSAWNTKDTCQIHPTYGEIVFNTSTWGDLSEEGDRCQVCLAGLWYLQKGYGLIGTPNEPIDSLEGLVCRTDYIPAMAFFIDDLRYPNKNRKKIADSLNIYIPDEIEEELVGGYMWEPYNPEHILQFLDWLLEQYTINKEEG